MPNVNNAAQLAQNIDYSGETDLMDMGRGIGAQFSGTPYRVYRIGSTSNGDWVQSGNLIATVMIDSQPIKPGDKSKITGKMATFFYDVSGDFALFLTGDFFYSIDPVYGTGSTLPQPPFNQLRGFCLASHPPIKTTVGGRIDRLVQVFRPNYMADSNGYLDQTFAAALPLICTAGNFALGTNGQTASFIPAGFTPDRTERQGLVRDIPDMTPYTKWCVYMPILPGFDIREGDIIQCQVQSNLTQPDRYRVVNPYIQQADVVGNQLICQKMVAQG